jgi:hypothetical protein
VLIIDAMHPSVEEIIKVQVRPGKRVILTHGLSAKLSKWLTENPQHQYEFAVENHLYTV